MMYLILAYAIGSAILSGTSYYLLRKADGPTIHTNSLDVTLDVIISVGIGILWPFYFLSRTILYVMDFIGEWRTRRRPA